MSDLYKENLLEHAPGLLPNEGYMRSFQTNEPPSDILIQAGLWWVSCPSASRLIRRQAWPNSDSLWPFFQDVFSTYVRARY